MLLCSTALGLMSCVFCALQFVIEAWNLDGSIFMLLWE